MNPASRQTTNQVHAAGESNISLAMHSLNVRFTATPPRQLQIKNTMKTSATIQDKKIIPSLFQVAAQIEDPSSAVSVKPATLLSETPFADLMMPPKKVAAALGITKTGDRGTSLGSLKRATQTAAAKKHGGGGGKPSPHSLVEAKFQLEAPRAGSVKLAADFTDWGKSPLDMTRSEAGIWHAVILLPPGDHSYRFIVDGQWCDDPHPALCVSNPFGTINAVVKVI